MQQRIVEVGELGWRKANIPANMNADPTAAHAMPDRLALCHIERVAECAEKLSKSHFVAGFATPLLLLFVRRHSNCNNSQRLTSYAGRQPHSRHSGASTGFEPVTFA